MKKVISILTAMLMLTASAVSVMPMQDNSLHASAVDFAELADQTAARVNLEREKQGIAPLQCSVALNNAAMIRCQEITIKEEHTRPDGTTFDSAIDEALNYAFYSSYAENFAIGMKTVQEAVNTWMNSEIHSGNILNPNLEYIGIAVYESNGLYYWTELFVGGCDPLSDVYLPELKEEPAYLLGDLDGDQIINSGDAAVILSAAAFIGSGAESGLTAEQELSADVNADGNINAEDASLVLRYAAESGTGFTGTLEEYLAKDSDNTGSSNSVDGDDLSVFEQGSWSGEIDKMIENAYH